MEQAAQAVAAQQDVAAVLTLGHLPQQVVVGVEIGTEADSQVVQVAVAHKQETPQEQAIPQQLLPHKDIQVVLPEADLVVMQQVVVVVELAAPECLDFHKVAVTAVLG